MKKLVLGTVFFVLAAAALLFIGGQGTTAATIFNAHVHDDYFHPVGGGFNVGPGHATAQALCMAANPDPTCTSIIGQGDSLMWVAPAPLAQNPHTVTECTDGTWSSCGAGVSAANPIEDSGVRFQPGWPYTVAFSQPGTFYYRCEIHPTVMRGTVVVEPAIGGGVNLITGTDGGSTTTYLLLSALASVLVLGTAGGVAWRRRRTGE